MLTTSSRRLQVFEVVEELPLSCRQAIHSCSGLPRHGRAFRRFRDSPRFQCTWTIPSIALTSAGLISRECATVTECSGASSLAPETKKAVEHGKVRAKIVFLPDIALQQPWMIWTAIQNVGRGQAVAFELPVEVLRGHPALLPARIMFARAPDDFEAKMMPTEAPLRFPASSAAAGTYGNRPGLLQYR